MAIDGDESSSEDEDDDEDDEADDDEDKQGKENGDGASSSSDDEEGSDADDGDEVSYEWAQFFFLNCVSRPFCFNDHFLLFYADHTVEMQLFLVGSGYMSPAHVTRRNVLCSDGW